MRLTGDTLALSVLSVKAILSGKISAAAISGPIEVARESAKKAAESVDSQSPMPILLLMISLSIMVAVFNLLPLAPLDGGGIVLSIYEGIARRRPSPRFIMVAQVAGLSFVAIATTVGILGDITELVMRR